MPRSLAIFLAVLAAGLAIFAGAYYVAQTVCAKNMVYPADDLVAVFLIQEVPRGDLDLGDRFRALVYQAIVADGSRPGGVP